MKKRNYSLRINKALCCLLFAAFVLLSNSAFSQGAAINTSGAAADPSAMLDVSGTSSGVLINRLTTAQRNAIINPAQALLIFNTTTYCLEIFANGLWQSVFCATCPTPSVVTASVSPNPICEGDVLTLTGSATGATAWSWTGPDNFTSTLQSPTISGITAAGAGVYTLTASNYCGDALAVNTASLTVTSLPAAPSAATHTPSQLQIIWDWSDVSGATGYQWNTTNSYPGVGANTLTSSTYTQTALICNTAYVLYIWAYNACGNSTVTTLTQNTSACPWSCGNPITDSRDGNIYTTVQIGNQCWMAQNLAYLDVVIGNGNYSKTIPYKHVYGYSGNDVVAAKATANYITYGVIYNWPAMLNGSSPCNGTGAPPNDKCTTPIQGVCPPGWHVPSHYEFTTLERNVGSNPGAFPYDNNTSNVYLGTDEGGNLKEAGTSHWAAPNLGATNSSGFNALPGGNIWMGTFYSIGTAGRWLSSSERDASAAWYRDLGNTYATVYRAGYSDSKWVGAYIRCVKD